MAYDHTSISMTKCELPFLRCQPRALHLSHSVDYGLMVLRYRLPTGETF